MQHIEKCFVFLGRPNKVRNVTAKTITNSSGETVSPRWCYNVSMCLFFLAVIESACHLKFVVYIGDGGDKPVVQECSGSIRNCWKIALQQLRRLLKCSHKADSTISAVDPNQYDI